MKTPFSAIIAAFAFNLSYAVEIIDVNPPYDNDSLIPNGKSINCVLSDEKAIEAFRVSNVGKGERLIISFVRSKSVNDVDITVRDATGKVVGDFREAKESNAGIISVENTSNAPFVIIFGKTNLGSIEVNCKMSLYSVEQIKKVDDALEKLGK